MCPVCKGYYKVVHFDVPLIMLYSGLPPFIPASSNIPFTDSTLYNVHFLTVQRRMCITLAPTVKGYINNPFRNHHFFLLLFQKESHQSQGTVLLVIFLYLLHSRSLEGTDTNQTRLYMLSYVTNPVCYSTSPVCY